MNIAEIIKKIKIILAHELNRLPKECEIANSLNLSKAHYSKIKKTNAIPFKNIVYFCAQKKININWLFFDQDIEYIQANSNLFQRLYVNDTIKLKLKATL